MNDQESHDFVCKYFDELFGNHDIDALDKYLDKSYFDDDIGDPQFDHINDSKEYLSKVFRETPTIGVHVNDTITHDNVISSLVERFVIENNQKRHRNFYCRRSENQEKTYLYLLRRIIA